MNRCICSVCGISKDLYSFTIEQRQGDKECSMCELTKMTRLLKNLKPTDAKYINGKWSAYA